jgi:hypothetical protein
MEQSFPKLIRQCGMGKVPCKGIPHHNSGH